MSDKLEPLAATTANEMADDRLDHLAIGQWYWVQTNVDDDDDDEDYDEEERERLRQRRQPWLGCVVHLGSNYAEVRGLSRSSRLAYSIFDDRCSPEHDPEGVIAQNVAKYRTQSRQLMNKIRQLTAELGLAPRGEIAEGGDTGEALVVLHGTANVKAHKAALIKAKKETLPELFDQIKRANDAMAEWMCAELIPLKAESRGLQTQTRSIEDRIFTVELYAGLVESLELIREGTPASNDDKVHLFQRRHYMDEECLLDYRAGGMEFKNIRAFDKWLLKKRNLRRILPFPRCVVAFKVRRHAKDREVVSWTDFINVQNLRALDNLTFLYIRNGDQVFRLNTEIDFNERLFPSRNAPTLNSGPLYYSDDAGSRMRVISQAEYEEVERKWAQELAEYQEKLRKWKASKKKKRNRPWEPVRWSSDSYSLVTPDDVFYDDVMEKLQREARAHNRVAVVLQGLLDRSPAFQPHPPWQLWTAEGFAQGVELVYDDDQVLTTGAPPDFEEFRARLNASITRGTHTIGQHYAWMRHEAEKFNDRMAANWRIRDYRPVKLHEPYGNPGPGQVAPVTSVHRDGSVSFAWQRERQRYSWKNNDPINTRFRCPMAKLLNVDAYTPGDYKIFYADPRTRRDYLRWAPLLLGAEDWHAARRREARTK